MSLILLATVFSGFLTTRLLLAFNLDNVLVRYPLAVIFAYLVFFIAMKLWLKYISPALPAARAHSTDAPGVLSDIPVSGPSGSMPAGDSFHGGGGGFAGGGASESFAGADVACLDNSTGVLSGGINTGSGIGDAIGNTAGAAAASALSDETGALVIFVVLAAIMAVVVGAGVYLVYEAPFILSEAAFEVILAASLLRGTRRIQHADWIGSVFKTTGIPFAFTLALSFLAGYLMHHYFPEATRISELFLQL